MRFHPLRISSVNANRIYRNSRCPGSFFALRLEISNKLKMHDLRRRRRRNNDHKLICPSLTLLFKLLPSRQKGVLLDYFLGKKSTGARSAVISDPMHRKFRRTIPIEEEGENKKKKKWNYPDGNEWRRKKLGWKE